MVEVTGEKVEGTETMLTPEEICKKYREMSRFRPPFSFEAKIPPYPESDETELFQMEESVFNIETYPIPPITEPQLLDAYRLLHERSATLKKGIQSIKELDGIHEEPTRVQDTVKGVRSKLDVQTEQRQNPESRRILFKSEKELWEKHYTEKKLFFHQALTYLLLISAYHPDEEAKKQSRRKYREAYAMFIGHQGTTYSRSASHELVPTRRDRTVTIAHPYRITVHGYNFWMKKIKQAKSEEEEAILFEELYHEELRDLFHDTLEDYFITPEDLAAKLQEMLNFDFRISTPFRKKDEEIGKQGERNTPSELNFVRLHEQTILKELWALKEEEEDKTDDPDKPYYLARKLNGIPEIHRARVYMTKLRDRINNLQAPRYKKPGKTLEKIFETLKILEIGPTIMLSQQISKNPTITVDDLRAEMEILTSTCLREIEKYSQTAEYKELAGKETRWVYLYEITKSLIEKFDRELVKKN